MKCYYHKDDYDGICSAAIICKAYQEVELIPSNYNTVPINSCGETIFIADLSFSEAIMKRLLSEGNKVIWIDHHITAIGMLSKLNLPGLREVGVGACELTWNYLFSKSRIPYCVQLLSNYDVWNFEDRNTGPFNYGLRGYKDSYDPKSELWTELLSRRNTSHFVKILETGRYITTYKELDEARYAKGMSYTTTFEGYTVLAINAPYKNSKVADSVVSKNHDFIVLFGIREDEWKYSLFENGKNINLGDIASKYGGGGHKGAAGFYSSKKLL